MEFFVEFYVEWICCACSKLNTHATADWLSVPGFVELTEAYFLLYSLPPSAPRPPQRYFFSCENLMLNTAVPLVLENIVRFHFCRTRVSDTGQVNECISFFESWLITLARARARVDSAFDATVLCAGIDGLLASDHHLILSKVLALFYNYAWIFHDTPRVALLGNVLLEKHFYHLFLHWDENVRNLFMQFILFRLLTCKRRDVVSAEVAAAAAAAASANTTSDSEQDDETATVTAVKPPETTEAKESKERERETKASTGTAATLEEGSRAVPESADFELIHKADAFIWAIGECAKQINSANAAARQSRRSGLRRSQLQHGSHQDAAAAAPRFVKGKKTYVTEDAPAPIVVSEECTEGAGREVEVAEEEEEEAMGTGGENEDGRLLKEGSVVIVEDEYDDDDDDDNDDNDDNDDEMGRRRRRRRGSEQYEDFTAPPVPDNLKIYIDRSLREFKKHLSRYEDWEAKTKDEPPKLLLYPSY